MCCLPSAVVAQARDGWRGNVFADALPPMRCPELAEGLGGREQANSAVVAKDRSAKGASDVATHNLVQSHANRQRRLPDTSRPRWLRVAPNPPARLAKWAAIGHSCQANRDAPCPIEWVGGRFQQKSRSLSHADSSCHRQIAREKAHDEPNNQPSRSPGWPFAQSDWK